ncbi:hypothetical protein B0H14DRAFT_2397881, partial [Mycena olivaceomarginata]
FPPDLTSAANEHRIISKMCKAVNPANFEEAGCAICGLLLPFTQLTPKVELELNYDVLKVPGVTRKERKYSDDPIEEVERPIMAEDCDHVCADCEARLLKNIKPLQSLANHLWVGKVPWQLKDLSHAEKMLVAKVRHNRCVIRVASGRGKLSANAIMFANPTVKVYNILPPTKDELSEVLAFVFLGPTKPTEDEFKRTPMLVCRERVKTALDWLKLNHSDYATLEISLEIWQTSPKMVYHVVLNGNRPKMQLSVHDDGEEEGTTSGPCTFAVHGLSGEVYNNMKIDALKAKALNHLANGGQVLGVGHAEKPEETWSNVQLYPQMFPWLFPYGLGGIGHPAHKKRLSEAKHKHHLLMYHDKRFQTDLYFPMVAFNDLQIKSGVTGSHLLAKRKNFGNIVEQLRVIEPAVLTDLAQRMEAGDHVVPENEAEKTCFDLLKDLDHVGGHVQGSMTSKKYMRNEVWSLITFKGAPSWFIDTIRQNYF